MREEEVGVVRACGRAADEWRRHGSDGGREPGTTQDGKERGTLPVTGRSREEEIAAVVVYVGDVLVWMCV